MAPGVSIVADRVEWTQDWWFTCADARPMLPTTPVEQLSNLGRKSEEHLLMERPLADEAITEKSAMGKSFMTASTCLEG